MSRPKATQRKTTVSKSYFNPSSNRREKGFSEETAIVRSASCGKGKPLHRSTSTFVGANENGWIFWCKDCGGHFVADPAE